MIKILLVEDDLTFGKMLEFWLLKKGFDTHVKTSIASAKKAIETDSFDLVLSDLRLPDSDGILFLQWIKEYYKSIVFIMMTNYADTQTAVSAMKLGAFDYLEKPVQPDLLIEKITGALSKKTNQETSKKKNAITTSPHFITGTDTVSKTVYNYLILVAPTNMSVLITGESGTGKEYAAKFIHNHSKRKDNPFIAIDCGILSKELGTSELFGHSKGSFTSAIQDKKGLFEAAAGGTVFLDEIGNLTYDVQIQLLRALQERKIKPIGSEKEIAIDVRIIAATNENLLESIGKGRFREDLYHRINEFSVQIPALRTRHADIMTFAHAFLSQANLELEKSVKDFAPEVEEIFHTYKWSGNLRQMNNVIKRSVLFCQGDTITWQDLPTELTNERKQEIETPLKRPNERDLILHALEKTGNNKSKAAKLLCIDRKTLYNKLELYHINLVKKL